MSIVLHADPLRQRPMPVDEHAVCTSCPWCEALPREQRTMPLVFPPLYHRVAALYRRELAAVAGDASKVEPCLRRTFARIADSVIAYWERMEPAEGVR